MMGAAFVTEDWNGRAIQVARSKSGVLATCSGRDSVMPGSAIWPPAELVQKLTEAGRGQFGEAHEAVQAGLGYRTPLQSINSEDAITFSFFGTLGHTGALTLSWLAAQAGLPDIVEERCQVSLWRRIPHPEKLTSTNGPELDALLIGDRVVAIIEAKWMSGEGQGQGIAGNRSQMELRYDWLANHAPRIFGEDRKYLLVALAPVASLLRMPATESSVIPLSITWRDLAESGLHPSADEFTRYYKWKVRHSGVRVDERVA